MFSAELWATHYLLQVLGLVFFCIRKQDALKLISFEDTGLTEQQTEVTSSNHVNTSIGHFVLEREKIQNAAVTSLIAC